ncbi:MAG: phosphate ABC transporter substrate-binding protein PstS [Anaerolineae bacterium]
MFRSKMLYALIALLGVALALAACGGGTTPAAPASTVVAGTAVPQPTSVKLGSFTINGAGATFPYPLYSRWFYDYAFVDPSVKFNYQSIGSGGGIAQITAKTVDFGASDAILNDDQFSKAPGIQMFPTVAGGIVPTYNIKGDDGNIITATIKFPYTSLADIFLGKITKWNDPVLAQANPDLKLPAKDIIIVHRSDGSGTTFAFTDYLSKVSDAWKTQVGSATSVKWPSGLGGKGNEGVAANVTQNDGAIGYVELAYAIQNKLPYGSVQNQANQYVMPTSDAIQSAMNDFGTNMGDKLALSIANAPGKGSWPISTYTYLLIYMDQQDCAKAQKVTAFVKWALSDGTKDATDLLYIPLPDAVKQQVLAKLGKITCQGKPLQ